MTVTAVAAARRPAEVRRPVVVAAATTAALAETVLTTVRLADQIHRRPEAAATPAGPMIVKSERHRMARQQLLDQRMIRQRQLWTVAAGIV